jgi:hypothetical protein
MYQLYHGITDTKQPFPPFLNEFFFGGFLKHRTTMSYGTFATSGAGFSHRWNFGTYSTLITRDKVSYEIFGDDPAWWTCTCATAKRNAWLPEKRARGSLVRSDTRQFGDRLAPCGVASRNGI